MELKLLWLKRSFLAMSCLNRTFMELKSAMYLIFVSMTYKSQSYLYGIEISTYILRAWVKVCLNRTFMELKLVSFLNNNLVMRLSQSYLYGIEIR